MVAWCFAYGVRVDLATAVRPPQTRCGGSGGVRCGLRGWVECRRDSVHSVGVGLFL